MATHPLPISLCMIVRDAADDLRDCLACVDGWFAQTVVVDTGSQDGTREVARAAGAEVHEFPWCDDFSAARNAALDHATESWVLVLDADERVDPSTYDALAHCLTHDADAFIVAYRTYTNALHGNDWVPNDGSAPEGWAAWVPGEVVRLFRNGRGFRFSGRVHETLDRSLQAAAARIVRAPFFIHHFQEEHGREYIAAKQQRYLRLMEQDIADGLGTAKHYTDVAIIHREFGNAPEEALPALHQAVQMTPTYQPAWRELVASYMALGRYPEAQQVAEQMAARWARDPLPRYGLGLIAQQTGNLAGAEAQFREAVRLDPAHPNARLKLAEVLLRQGNAATARGLLEALHAEFPTHADVLRQLSAAYAFLRMGREGAAVLERAVQALPDDAVLWNNLGVMRAQNGDSSGAAAAFERVLALNPAHPDARKNLAALAAAG